MANSPYSTIESSTTSTIAIYKRKNWDFQVSGMLKCSLCKSILADPIQTDCGCRYCRQCIDTYLIGGPKRCRGDSDECSALITSYISDKATHKEISSLTVNCLYGKCNFQGMLRNMGNHLACCDYRMVPCVLCSMDYVAMEAKNHVEKECPMREVECPDCCGTFTYQDFTNNHSNVDHEELCPKYMSLCPYKCDVKGKVFLSSHRKECKNKPSLCPYHSFGCKSMISYDKMPEHLEKLCQQHCMMMVEMIDQVRTTNEEIRKENISLKADLKSVTTQMESMKIEYEKISQQLDRYQRQTQPSVAGRSDPVFRNGKYIWKLENFSKLKENAANGINLTMTSDSFYTSEFGYRMCLKVYPNGDGLGKSTHLSVFFVIMRGEFDELQSWPFRNKVTLTILEDLAKSTNHSDTFKPDARSICYQKPTEESNIASGSPKFISFTDLNRFLKNDTLYLQIVVLPV